MELTNARVVGYEDPALEGQIITYSCPPGQILNGSNSSTCMRNGKWEPDLGEVECIGKLFHPALYSSCYCVCPDDLVIHNI